MNFKTSTGTGNFDVIVLALSQCKDSQRERLPSNYLWWRYRALDVDDLIWLNIGVHPTQEQIISIIEFKIKRKKLIRDDGN